jgi:hypothetical protein
LSTPEAITNLLIDDDNEDKFAAHGLSARQIVQVLASPYLIVPNRRGRSAPYLLIGVDFGGACIAIPIEATHDPGVWRPKTAWRCKDSERARLETTGGVEPAEPKPTE